MSTDVKKIQTDAEVVLPGWCGDAFVCVLRRPSLLALASRGAITNPLMKTARKLFYAGVSAESGNLEEEGRVLLEIAAAALVRPTFAELEACGIELTDEQLIAIFQYTQAGVKALERFRGLTAGDEYRQHGTGVSSKAKRDAGNP